MPSGISKKVYKRTCLICKEKFETTSHKARICQKKVCKNKSRYILYGKKYRTTYKTNPDCKLKTELVDSTCPKCRCKHKAETKWNYCDKCQDIIMHYNIQEVTEHRIII